MPNHGTATNTTIASAVVVDSDPVGVSKPGTIVARLAVAMKRNSVPMKPMYKRGRCRPISSIWPAIVVTTISSRFCQRDRVCSCESLRVTSQAPTVSTAITTHVKTRVALMTKGPLAQ